MGTYTKHKLKVINSSNLIDDMIRLSYAVSEVTNNYISERDFFPSEGINDSRWNGGAGSKWYSFHDDIIKISERLPDLEIYVHYESETGYEYEALFKGGVKTSYHCISEVSSLYDDAYADLTEEEIHKDDFGVLVNSNK